MIVYAAIDLSRGRVVQLVGGRPEEERVNLPDPVAVARRWIDAGFAALHVIDLDAAMGTGSNSEEIAAILGSADVPVQIGGGVREEATVDDLFARGAATVIVGTRAIEEPDWLVRLAARHPLRLVVAADVREHEVVVRGWTSATGIAIEQLLDQLEPLELAGVLVTDVNREGRLRGADEDLFRTITPRTRHKVIAAGGIKNDADLTTLATTGVAGAVVGMSLYTGTIDAQATAEEYKE